MPAMLPADTDDTGDESVGSVKRRSSECSVSPSTHEPNRSDRFNRIFRRAKPFLPLTVFPLIAIALYLYWLTLPEYEPTGNEVYDAFAPVAYEEVLMREASARMMYVCGKYPSAIPILEKLQNFSMNSILVCLPELRPYRMQEPTLPQEMESRFRNSKDYLYLKFIIGEEDQNDFSELETLYYNETEDPGLYVILLFKCSTIPFAAPDDVYKKAFKFFPEYSIWYYKKANRCFRDVSDHFDKYANPSSEYPVKEYDVKSPEYAEYWTNRFLEATTESVPLYFPLSVAMEETKKNKPLVNEVIAYYIRNLCRYYNGEADLCSYDQYKGALDRGELDWKYIDTVLSFSYKLLSIGEYGTPSSDIYSDVKYYFRMYCDAISDLLILTSEQEKKKSELEDRMNRISLECETRWENFCFSQRPVAKQIYRSGYEMNVFNIGLNSYAISELSKLDPPTIADWLAGGATLKPRQGSSTVQGAAVSP